MFGRKNKTSFFRRARDAFGKLDVRPIEVAFPPLKAIRKSGIFDKAQPMQSVPQPIQQPVASYGQPEYRQPTQQPQANAYEKALEEMRQRDEVRRQGLMQTNQVIQGLQDNTYAQRATQNAQRRQRLEQRRDAVEGAIPGIQENLKGQYEGNVAKKGDVYEKERRKLVEMKRATDNKRRNLFANLGTVDSGGYYGFTGQQSNADTRFMSGQQELTGQKMDSIDTIYRNYKKEEADALEKVQTRVQSFDDLIAELDADQDKTDAEKQMLLIKNYQTLQKELSGIGSTYESAMLKASQDKAKSDDELQQALREKKVETDKINYVVGQIFSPRGQPLDDQELIHKLKGVYGWGRLKSNIPESEASTLRARMRQLVNSLAVLGRQAIKGQGAITEGETAMLKSALTTLDDFNQSPEDAFREIANIKRFYGSGQLPSQAQQFQFGEFQVEVE